MSWQERALDELGSVSRGRSRHRPRDAAFLYDGPYPFVQTGDVKHSGLYLTEYQQTYSEAGLDQSKLWPTGTLCITIAANIAETSILGIEACFPDSVIGFVADEEKSDTRFVKYMFDATLKYRYRSFTQGAAQDNLSQGKLLSLIFSIPELDVQRRIGDILSAHDDLIENNRRRMALLEEAARQLYREWFVRLRFPGREHTRITDGVPEGWQACTIGDLGMVVTGKTPSKKNASFYGGGVAFIKTPDMHRASVVVSTEEMLSDEGAKSQANRMLPPRSILVSCIGSVGVVAFNGTEGQTNQQINAIVVRDEVLRYWTYFMAKELKTRLEAMGGGATMANVNKKKFASIKTLVPPETLLREYNDFARSVFDQIENLTIANGHLARARDLLLPRLMSGDLAV